MDIFTDFLYPTWGSAKFVTLNSETFPSMKEGIPLDALPKTFRDSALVTRKFNIRYLWTDSLYRNRG
jgi:hypothetical protein